MSATKENAYNYENGDYEFTGYGANDDSDYQYQQYLESIGLGLRVHIDNGWMWFCGFKFGLPVVDENVKLSKKIAPSDLQPLVDKLQSLGYQISIMLRK